MTTKPLYQHLASALQARANCERTGNTEWYSRHTETIETLAQFLPSGSGFDAGTKVDINASGPDKIVMLTSFHHMNDGGVYDGWTEHTVTIRPAFDGYNMGVSGHDRNGIKDYIADAFDTALHRYVQHTIDGFRQVDS